MNEEQKPRLRLLRGGRDGLRLGPLLVKVAPPEEPPFAAEATVAEEDSWLVLSAAPEIRPPAGHPLRILTGLLAAKPLAPGSVVVGSQVPLHEQQRLPASRDRCPSQAGRNGRRRRRRGGTARWPETAAEVVP